MPNKDLLNSQNDILSQFTADDDDVEKNQLGNTNNEEDEDDELDTSNDAGDNNDEDDEDDRSRASDEDDEENDQRERREKNDDEEDDLSRSSATEAVARQQQQNSPFYFKADKLGNLVDSQGRVVFAKGRPRNIFEKLKKAHLTEARKAQTIASEFTKVVETSKELLRRYKEARDSNNLGKSLGLTEDEQKEAVQMRALMKSDTKAAIRQILTKAHMNGINLTDLGVSGPLDAKTVAEHVIAMQEAKRPKPETEEQKLVSEARSFLQQFPDAAPHIDLVAEAKRKYPHMTLGQIWYQISLHANRGPRTKQPGADRNQQRQPRDGSRPIPRNNQPPRRSKDGKLSITPVDPSQSFKQIGQDLLRDLQEIEGR